MSREDKLVMTVPCMERINPDSNFCSGSDSITIEINETLAKQLVFRYGIRIPVKIGDYTYMVMQDMNYCYLEIASPLEGKHYVIMNPVDYDNICIETMKHFGYKIFDDIIKEGIS